MDIHFVTPRHYCTFVAAEVQNVARRMSERAKPAHQLITVQYLVNMPNEEALVFATVETLGNLARLWGTLIENRTSHRRALYTTCNRVSLVDNTKRV